MFIYASPQPKLFFAKNFASIICALSLLATEDNKKKGANCCGKLGNKANDQKEEVKKDKYRSRRHMMFTAGYPTNF